MELLEVFQKALWCKCTVGTAGIGVSRRLALRGRPGAALDQSAKRSSTFFQLLGMSVEDVGKVLQSSQCIIWDSFGYGGHLDMDPGLHEVQELYLGEGRVRKQWDAHGNGIVRRPPGQIDKREQRVVLHGKDRRTLLNLGRGVLVRIQAVRRGSKCHFVMILQHW